MSALKNSLLLFLHTDHPIPRFFGRILLVLLAKPYIKERWPIFSTMDSKEGMKAFKEKRKPEYKGR